MPDWVRHLVIFFLVGGIGLAIACTKARVLENGRKVIRLNRPLTVLLVLGAATIVALALWTLFWGLIKGNVEGVPTLLGLIIICGLPLPLFITTLLTDMYDVYWDETSVTGPSKVYGFGVRKSRITIPFSEISRTGTTLLQSNYAESRDGRRIYWSGAYTGCSDLEREIDAHLAD